MPSIDRLSALPDEVVCHILSFLPTDLSVSTSILARRWRFLWAHVPNLHFGVRGHGRDELKIETIDKVMSLYRVKNMNAFNLFSYDWKCRGFQIEICISAAIDRNVKKLGILWIKPGSFPSCIFTCESVVDLHLTGCGQIPMTGDKVCLPALKKLFLSSVVYESHESLPYLLSCCPVLEELEIDRLDPDVACFIVSSRTINSLVLDSTFVGNNYDGYTVKIDAPALRYLEICDFVSKDVSAGPLGALIKANIQIDNHVLSEGGEDEDDDDASVEEEINDDNLGFNDEDDDALVEEGINDALVEADENHGFHDEAPMEGDVLYALRVFEFVGSLCNVKYLSLSTHWMEVSDSQFATWTVNFHNLTKLVLRGDSRFIPKFLENANNLEALTYFQDNEYLKWWMEPKQVPTCLLSHLRTVKIDDFGFMDQEFDMVSYILRNSKVLERMEIHSKCYGVDVEEKFEALKLISLFKRGSVECELAFQ